MVNNELCLDIIDNTLYSKALMDSNFNEKRIAIMSPSLEQVGVIRYLISGLDKSIQELSYESFEQCQKLGFSTYYDNDYKLYISRLNRKITGRRDCPNLIDCYHDDLVELICYEKIENPNDLLRFLLRWRTRSERQNKITNYRREAIKWNQKS